MGGEGFEPSKASPTDLQSAPFGHSGIHPEPILKNKQIKHAHHSKATGQTTQMRLELTTSAVTGRRSNQLSHWAIIISKVEGLHPQNHRKYRKRRVGRPHFGWPSGQLLDLLVSVSSVHYCTSTSDLSTSSSSRGLTTFVWDISS